MFCGARFWFECESGARCLMQFCSIPSVLQVTPLQIVYQLKCCTNIFCLPSEIYNQCVDFGSLAVLKKRVKFSRYRPGVTQRVGRGIALLFHDRGTKGGEWSAARPGRTLPPGKTRCPFYRRLGGPQGRSGRTENLVPTGIRSRTVQTVISRYTD